MSAGNGQGVGQGGSQRGGQGGSQGGSQGGGQGGGQHDGQRLRGREVAFTGRMASMTRGEATARVTAAGGEVVGTPGPGTAYLVVGQGGWPLRGDGHPTASMLRARSLKQQPAAQLEVVSETSFLQILGLTEKVEDLERLFTTAQLSRILELPPREIRSWVRCKLIRPVKVVRRLAWFDFREVAMARALHALTSAGVSAARISRSVRELSQWLPDAERMLTQLETFAHGRSLSIRLQDGRLADPAGQLLLDFHRRESNAPGPDIRPFDPRLHVAPEQGSGLTDRAVPPGAHHHPAPTRVPPPTGAGSSSTEVLPPIAGRPGATDFSLPSGSAEELFLQGVEAENWGHWERAAVLYERSLEVGGPDPETCFNLGNVLYELDRKREAAKRYLQAVELDPEYVESLNNLGNALADTGWLNEAVNAYRRALRVEPDYADAHSNLAEALVYLGRYREARCHWDAYLRIDPHSSWARAIRELIRNLPDDPA